MRNTQKLCISYFGPMGLFEEARALKADEQKGRNVEYESSIMMTMFHKALLSHPLTGLQRQSVNHREYLSVFTRKLGISLPVIIINICKCISVIPLGENNRS